MSTDERISSVIEHMLLYCRQIDEAHELFGRDVEVFRKTSTYFNAVTMCILQIGELVGHLGEAFIAAHPSIPWRQIRGMRNVVAHEYGVLDTELVWEAANEGVAELKEFCETYLKG